MRNQGLAIELQTFDVISPRVSEAEQRTGFFDEVCGEIVDFRMKDPLSRIRRPDVAL